MAAIPIRIFKIGKLADSIANIYFFLINNIQAVTTPINVTKGYAIKLITKVIVGILSSEPGLSNIIADIIIIGNEGSTKIPKIILATIK